MIVHSFVFQKEESEKSDGPSEEEPETEKVKESLEKRKLPAEEKREPVKTKRTEKSPPPQSSTKSESDQEKTPTADCKLEAETAVYQY